MRRKFNDFGKSAIKFRGNSLEGPIKTSNGILKLFGSITDQKLKSSPKMVAYSDSTSNASQSQFKNNSSQQLKGAATPKQAYQHHSYQQQRRPMRRQLYSLADWRPLRASKLLLLLTIALVSANNHQQLVQAQCPWARDSIDLHSDCICDFNPQSIGAAHQIQASGTATTTSTSATTLNGGFQSEQPTQQQQQVARRMSVQCAPVDFEQLLRALKQAASIELPLALAGQNFVATSNGTRQRLELDQGDGDDLDEDKARFISQTKLDLLHVGNSTISTLHNDTFLTDARQQKIEQRIPSDQLVVAIQTLHLSRCAISRIEPNAFNGLEWSLTSLSLQDNRLEEVPRAALERLASLRLLDLSNNRLKQLASGTFLTLNKLHTLRLADNKQLGVSGIELGAFEGLENGLNDLSLKNTQLTEFPVAISRLKSLAFLNLAQNQIAKLPERMFAQMNSLTAINLERNRISRIEGDTFGGVESTLSSLSLLGNLIESFPVNQLRNLSALRRLDLGFNRIETLPLESLVANKRLMLIALDGNPLETLPEAAFKPLEGSLRGLSVGGKSLDCDCRLSWMLRWQIEHNFQISSRERAPQFCAKPAYLRSLVSFAALQPEHLTCSAQQQFGASSVVPESLLASGGATQTDASFMSHLVPSSPQSSSSWSSGNAGGWTATGSNADGTSKSDSSSSSTYFTLPMKTTRAASYNGTRIASAFDPTKKPTAATQSVADSTPPIGTIMSTSAALSPSYTIEYVNNSTSSSTLSSSPSSGTTNSAAIGNGLEKSEPTMSSSISTSPSERFSTTTTSDEELSDEDDSSASESEPDSELTSEASTTSSTTANIQPASLQDDELFGAEAHEPNRRKSNRHGYLAPDDLLRHNKTTPASNTLAGDGNFQALPSTNIDRLIQTVSAPTTFRPTSGAFGDRQRTQQMSSTSDQVPAARHVSSRPAPVSSTGQRIPAIPTPINVYKPPPATQRKTELQKSSTEVPATNFRTRSQQQAPRYEPPIPKGARFVGESAPAMSTQQTTFTDPPLTTTTIIRRRPTTTPSAPTTTVNPQVEPELSFDAERYHQQAASSVQAQLSTLIPTLALVSTSSAAAVAPQQQQTATLVENPEPSSTNKPAQVTSQQFNTRMSVSSIYNLNMSAPKVASTTRVRPTTSSTTSQIPTSTPLSTTTSTSTTTRSSTTSTTSKPTTSTTTGPTTTTPAPSTRRLSSSSEQTERTTRMATTVRIVDGPLGEVQLVTGTSRTSSPIADTIQHAHSTRQVVSSTRRPIVSLKSEIEQQTPSSGTTSSNLINPTTSTTPIEHIQESAGPFGNESNSSSHLLVHTSSSSAVNSEVMVNNQTANNEDHSARRNSTRLLRKETISTGPGQRGDHKTGPTNQLIDSATRSLARRFPRLLADFDQVALILAGLMCVSIFVITIIMIIVTYCSLPHKSASHNEAKCRSNDTVDVYEQHDQMVNQPARSHWLTRLFCCCFCCKSKTKQNTLNSLPIRNHNQLMLQHDDDNSTSSSSGGGSSSHLVSSNSLGAAASNSVLCQNQYNHHSKRHQSGDKRRPVRSGTSCGTRSKPLALINYDNSMRVHKHTTDKEYFLHFSTSKSHQGGRRVSRCRSELELEANQSSNRQDPVGWLSDSCDSDKSCSPGANKNNRYNMSEAHRAYLAGKQIQPSMFVTSIETADNLTHKPLAASNGSAAGAPNTITNSLSTTGRRNYGPAGKCAGLLKTIEMVRNTHHSDSSRHFYQVASDRSTDDSQVPLGGATTTTTNACHQEEASRAYQNQLVPLNRSISMLSKCLPSARRDTSTGQTTFSPQTVSRHHHQQQEQQRSNLNYFTTMGVADLVPISAEEEWPEPYLEPLGNEEPPLATGYYLGEQQQRPSQSANQVFESRQQHCEDRQFEHYIQEPQIINEVPASVRAYDDAYLANWRTVSRNSRSHRSQGGGVNWLRWTSTGS